MGYGAGPLVTGLKTTATMFGGAFAASAKGAPVTIDPTKAMDKTPKEIFKTQRTILHSTRKLAMGGGGDYASFPDQVCLSDQKTMVYMTDNVQAGDYSSSVAKFMADAS